MTDPGRDLATLAADLRASTVRVHDGRRGSGSGTVWTEGGLIVTNAHVVRGPGAAVEFEDGRRERAELVDRDDSRDLAALRIAAGGLRPVPVRAAATLRPGELVLAVGNPLGFVGALSTGIVQRRNPRWVVADVRLAPGNSGGPLADGRGRVVGINSMVAGGLGFAVPSEAVAAFLGQPQRRRLGIAGVPGRLAGAGGARLAFVVTAVAPDSVAERSGLALGDAIFGTDVGPLRPQQDVAVTLAGAASVQLLRAGVPHSLPLAWPARNRATDAA